MTNPNNQPPTAPKTFWQHVEGKPWPVACKKCDELKAQDYPTDALFTQHFMFHDPSTASAGDDEIEAILKRLQVDTIKNYQTAVKDNTELAETLLPDAWSMRLDEAKAAIKKLLDEAVLAARLEGRLQQLGSVRLWFATGTNPIINTIDHEIAEVKAKLKALQEGKNNG